jgi:Na+-driven multidrug efflux pump
MRTYVGRNIGKQQFGAAKRIARWAVILACCLTIPLWIIVGIYHSQIAYFFTDVPATLSTVGTNIVIYSVVGPIDCLCSLLQSLMRITNKVWVQNASCLVTNLVLGNLMLGLGFWVFDWGKYSVMVAFVFAQVLMTLFYVLILFVFIDWSKIQALDTDADELPKAEAFTLDTTENRSSELETGLLESPKTN